MYSFILTLFFLKNMENLLQFREILITKQSMATEQSVFIFRSSWSDPLVFGHMRVGGKVSNVRGTPVRSSLIPILRVVSDKYSLIFSVFYSWNPWKYKWNGVELISGLLFSKFITLDASITKHPLNNNLDALPGLSKLLNEE